ncbi:MutG family lantibiotic protection ABC superfamily ATP binding cassette transporter permease subunit [Streptococcus sanguinis SK150]|uniref:MutG family lantibiotic protection ABC superfamily ATP binding cassette transporter permease subunit n=1 Tax=Streptococcus sanguinis SK150 TaxID=888811 RepID=F0IM92_STRSA|nr:hypothetical protein [Streptococcus sanguinis]EGD36362.1 MutG family lantibiotic protection ABC superfamily ATP binding cassette transporter permease subunit [Streptococcus sanguinis SK150]
MRKVKRLIKKYKKGRVNYQKISKDELEKIDILAERNDITSEMSTEAIIFCVLLLLIDFLFWIYSIIYNSFFHSSNCILFIMIRMIFTPIMIYLTSSMLVTLFFHTFNTTKRSYQVIRFIISIIFILIPYANHFKELTETKSKTQNELIIPLVFFVVFGILIEILVMKIKSKTSFHFKYEVFDSIESIVSTIVYMLSILTIFYNTDWETRRTWTTLFVLMMISSEVLKNVNKFRINKGHEIAQKIFQEQLLLEKPRYEELKKCYYHGGEKYKEKLLSTEKFLQLIKEREVYNINYKRRRLRSRRRKRLVG